MPTIAEIELECQALLIRYEVALAACDYAESVGERLELLASVIMPSDNLLDASMERAKQIGVGRMAAKMAAGMESKKIYWRKIDPDMEVRSLQWAAP